MRRKTLLRDYEPLARRELVEAALMRLMSLPESVRPFVVIEHRPSKRFVQFCGSLTRPLTFDVPALDTSIELGPGSEVGIYTSAAALALMTLGSLVYRSFVRSENPGQYWTAIETSPHLVLEEAHDGLSAFAEAS